MLAETLLERAEQMTSSSTANHHDRHHHHHLHGSLDKHAWEAMNCAHASTPTAQNNHHFNSLSKLRRERSCHDIPVKEVRATRTTSKPTDEKKSKIIFHFHSNWQSTAMYNLQRQIRSLKEHLQKKELLVDSLKRKLKLMDENARNKCTIQVNDERTNRFQRNAAT